MKNMLFLLITMLSISCSSSIKSITNRTKNDKKYRGVIFILKKTPETKILVSKMQSEIELQFSKKLNSFSTNILYIEDHELKLNSHDYVLDTQSVLDELKQES